MIEIFRSKSHWELKTSLSLPISIHRVFSFFADASNLEELTPKWLHFQILKPGKIEMKAGQTIDYRLKLHGFPIRWRSLITDWNPPYHFCDLQIKGPYRLWRHDHFFEEIEDGCIVRDQVQYNLIGGRLINGLFVEPDLHKIFEFRCQKLKQTFGVA